MHEIRKNKVILLPNWLYAVEWQTLLPVGD